MKGTTYCWLLIFAGTTALAQTQPRQQRVTKHVAVQQPMLDNVCRKLYVEQAYGPLPLSVLLAEFFDSNRVYSHVEQMPALHGQQSLLQVIAAINECLVMPSSAPTGRVFVQFEVDKAGRVRRPQILKGLRADLDSAVVAAVRKLPCFTPGFQHGQAVAVRLTLPMTIAARKQP